MSDIPVVSETDEPDNDLSENCTAVAGLEISNTGNSADVDVGEIRAQGSIAASTLNRYFASVGFVTLGLIVMALLLMQACDAYIIFNCTIYKGSIIYVLFLILSPGVSQWQ